MKKNLIFISSLFVAALMFYSCAETPPQEEEVGSHPITVIDLVSDPSERTLNPILDSLVANVMSSVSEGFPSLGEYLIDSCSCNIDTAIVFGVMRDEVNGSVIIEVDEFISISIDLLFDAYLYSLIEYQAVVMDTAQMLQEREKAYALYNETIVRYMIATHLMMNYESEMNGQVMKE